MASHSLAIAKASLAAGLMRPEPKPSSKTDIALFHRLLDALLAQCSAANIQLCKEWLLKNTASSAAKTGAIGKYLVAFSATSSSSVGNDGTRQANEPKNASRSRQLHILYLLHDFLHHSRFHGAGLADSLSINRTLEPYISQLVTLAATHDPNNHMQHFIKLNDLIDIWNEADYFPSSVVAALRETVTNASISSILSKGNIEPSEASNGPIELGIGEHKEAPYIMPSSHGDASAPFYDLPAGNLMPHIIPNSSAPINPQMVKPLQFRAGPADEKLARAVKAFLQEVNIIYGSKSPQERFQKLNIDELGQTVVLNDTSQESPASEGYYGWSKMFCEKMKLRNSGDHNVTSPPYYSTAQHLHKRARRSHSNSDRSRSRSASTSQSTSSSGETGRIRRRPGNSDPRSRSPSRVRHSYLDRKSRRVPQAKFGPSRSRSMSYSPPDVAASQRLDGRPENTLMSGSAHDQVLHAAPPPPAFMQQGLLGPGQIPIPPPPPPDYSGPWVSLSGHSFPCSYVASWARDTEIGPKLIARFIVISVETKLTASLRSAPSTATATLALGALFVTPNISNRVANATYIQQGPLELLNANGTTWPRIQHGASTGYVWTGVRPLSQLRLSR
ncbi:MAG: hypothetical protein Q9166_006974 [cf. Caloplaca sp. 2 TL-2023]